MSFSNIVWVTNFLGFFGATLFFYKFFLLRQAKKRDVLEAESTRKKIQFCNLWKYFVLAFVLSKVILVLYLMAMK